MGDGDGDGNAELRDPRRKLAEAEENVTFILVIQQCTERTCFGNINHRFSPISESRAFL